MSETIVNGVGYIQLPSDLTITMGLPNAWFVNSVRDAGNSQPALFDNIDMLSIFSQLVAPLGDFNGSSSQHGQSTLAAATAMVAAWTPASTPLMVVKDHLTGMFYVNGNSGGATWAVYDPRNYMIPIVNAVPAVILPGTNSFITMRSEYADWQAAQAVAAAEAAAILAANIATAKAGAAVYYAWDAASKDASLQPAFVAANGYTAYQWFVSMGQSWSFGYPMVTPGQAQLVLPGGGVISLPQAAPTNTPPIAAFTPAPEYLPLVPGTAFTRHYT